MKLRVANGRIASRRGVLDAATIEIADGRITALDPACVGSPEIDLDGGWLVPGFIDTQVNGGGGVLFNDELTVDGIAAIGAAHAKFGTTTFLPTLISDSPEHIAAALDAVDAAIAVEVPGVVGVHIEGPFISAVKRGIHDEERIRLLDPELVELLSQPRRGRVVLTVAPEQVSTAHIKALVANGVIVCAGHSDASYDETRAAIAAGLTGFTHLFNAMSPLTHRAPGVVGAALDAPGCWCGLIVDNAHLHPATVRIAIAAKGRDRIMLVTDAMPSVGTDAASFMLQGKRIEVHDGVCTFEDGTLAGSDLDMATAFRNTAELTGLGPAEVSEMASAAPAAFLGLTATHGALATGRRADWVVLDRALGIRETWIGGTRIAAAANAYA